MKEVQLPSSTGKYKIGTCVFSVIDHDRIEMIGPAPGSKGRRIRGRLYYPVLPSDTVGVPKDFVLSPALCEGLSRAFHVKIKDQVQGDYYLNASPAPGKFPLIVYSHGLGAYAEANHFLCSELASHGYNVLAVGHAFDAAANEYEDGSVDFFDKSLNSKTYQPFLPGAVATLRFCNDKRSNNEELGRRFNVLQEKYYTFLIEYLDERAKDIRSITEETIRRFGQRIDLTHGIGITGHSMGGATAYYMCRHDDLFTAGINLDGILAGRYDGCVMSKPFYQINCETNVNVSVKAALDTDAPFFWEVFKGMQHHGFCDLKFFVPISAIVGKMPPSVLHENLCRIHKTFFDRYLKGSTEEVFCPEGPDFIRRA